MCCQIEIIRIEYCIIILKYNSDSIISPYILVTVVSLSCPQTDGVGGGGTGTERAIVGAPFSPPNSRHPPEATPAHERVDINHDLLADRDVRPTGSVVNFGRTKTAVARSHALLMHICTR